MRTREKVREGLRAGKTSNEIAREIGMTKSTVCYHRRRLGHEINEKCNRRYDWAVVQTGELIRAKIADLDAHQTQDLVAGILRSMGYFTQISPEGKDGGVDIVASRDALGVEPPIIKVQVKAGRTAAAGPVKSANSPDCSHLRTSAESSSLPAATPETPRPTPRFPGSVCSAWIASSSSS